MKSKITKSFEIVQYRIELLDTDPLVWRRIQTRSDITLAEFHRIIQWAMGWQNKHLYSFFIDGEKYFEDRESLKDDSETRNAKRISLRGVLSTEPSLYTYDFGDNWKHRLVLEEGLEAISTLRYPICSVGENACPPEDCGGIYGYRDLLEKLADPQNPDYAEATDWLGAHFDPKKFARPQNF